MDPHFPNQGGEAAKRCPLQREIGGALRRHGDRGFNFDPIGRRFAPTYRLAHRHILRRAFLCKMERGDTQKRA
ncbi:hypothetical protein NONS58_31260 [Nitrosococcus oceani]|nr:hypothetical protein NONS58_31260 [Nitrosococcus oceani]